MRRLSVRLLAFNIMLIFLPLASLLYLDTYETQLLDTQEGSMIQQGRILASALTGTDLAAEAALVLGRLGGRVDSRLRVVDAAGRLIADSATMVPSAETAATGTRSSYGAAGEPAAPVDSRKANERALYRTVVYPLNLLRRFLSPPSEAYDSGEYYSGKNVLLGPEVVAALEGRYGAVTRLSSGGQVSVNLYSAIPIVGVAPGDVLGAVLVSRSTYGILVKLYALRLDIIRISVVSLVAAALLSLTLSMTITSPIGRLKSEAETVLDSAGRFRGRFTGLRRKDEIGDLSRALSSLSERLEKRIAYIDGFTADLLHELKNPLAAIRGATELALEAESPNDERTSLLERVRDEERRMERLLAGLREMGGIDNRLDGESVQPVDLRELVPVALSRYPHRDYPMVGVRFEVGVDRPALVRVNPDRLVQAITNPVDNAVSFSRAGATVSVRLYERGGAYVIDVDDVGPGIAEASRNKAFDRFYSDRPEGESDAHSGLGLAIVKAIAAGYGGSCSIGDGPRGGCRFSLTLPKA
ncbi:MAG: histidine kinase [Spirochaetae bacterium HGW-Spirochaetae-3]|jgi:two-component system sensor histidine kinase ChvG|nr:MAG: histidine kinase [Spirochaetae bacterium HGW-Spirochaetae-3]